MGEKELNMNKSAKETVILRHKVSGNTIRIVKKKPVIVSASRSTDIPAFFADWFFQRLTEGFSIWQNPFNRSESGKQYISYEDTRAIVFWTKNPMSFLVERSNKENIENKYTYIDFLEKKHIEYYFQFTLNNYERENLEPNLPPLQKRIEIFKNLSNRVSPKRIIWRFDPLIKIPGCSVEDLIKRIFMIGEQIKGYTNKLVFSFADIQNYRGVTRNLIKACSFFSDENIASAEFSVEEMENIAKRLRDMCDYWKSQGWDVELASCAEKIDLDKFGISHNRCIDAALLLELAEDSHNSALIEHIESFLNKKNGFKPTEQFHASSGDLFAQFDSENSSVKLSDLKIEFQNGGNKKFKDKGQREECQCMTSKDIGQYHTCMHGCVYCYATVNHDTKETARKRKEFIEESNSYELTDK